MLEHVLSPRVTLDPPRPAVLAPSFVHLTCDSRTDPTAEFHRFNEIGDLPEVTRWLSGREGTGTQISSLPAQRLSLSILKSASARKPWLPASWA